LKDGILRNLAHSLQSHLDVSIGLDGAFKGIVLFLAKSRGYGFAAALSCPFVVSGCPWGIFRRFDCKDTTLSQKRQIAKLLLKVRILFGTGA
jgi:hypothetical protein